MRTLHWFRNDLRITDNTALYHASHQAREGCLAVYIITPKTWIEHNVAACRVDFILHGLRQLKVGLNKFNIPFLILNAPSFSDIPQLLLKICEQYQIEVVHFNQQYEVDEIACDKTVAALLSGSQIVIRAHHDQTIIAPQVIRTQKQEAFTIFTPFKKAWIKHYQEHPVTLLPQPKRQSKPIILIEKLEVLSHVQGFDSLIDPELWPAGEQAAMERLVYFTDHILVHYKEWRDFPAIDGTSRLSPYLACGMISARQCLQAALVFNNGLLDQGHEGAATWISELIWREFYKTILVDFPRVCRYRPFKLNTEKLIWDDRPDLLDAWQTGQTGFPLIDAAMRQLQQTGWMHNRLRMVVAMFFTKQLWLDWRLGEQFFMQHLIDGDLAANNGGWQWCASTGHDAAPYFRIFNPITQSQRFDSEGIFIRHYCPELRDLNDHEIHNPYASGDLFLNFSEYPRPIVDYKSTRARAIAAFKALG